DVPSLDGMEPLGIPLPPNPGRQSEYEIGADGRLEIDGLAAGVEDRLGAMDRQPRPLAPLPVFQPLDAVIQVQAGATLALGGGRVPSAGEGSAAESPGSCRGVSAFGRRDRRPAR